MAVMGRPKIYTQERIAEIETALRSWTQLPDSRYLASFCADNGLWTQKLTELAAIDENFQEALKIAHTACESRLAQLTQDSGCPTAFGIFALKQHNWTDKTEIGGMKDKPIEIKGLNESDLEARIADLLGKTGAIATPGREGETSEAAQV